MNEISKDQYAVIGNPIKHSKSPLIHSLFAKQLNQVMDYTAITAEEDRFEAVVKQFFANNGKGLNVTVPFKLQAFDFADQLTDRAQLAGAVNTLALQADGTVLGDNTDGCGIVQDVLHNQDWQIADKRVLILGAGGAVRGVLQPILEQKPDLLVIANRTVEKAQRLAADFSEFGETRGCSFEALSGNSFDLIINGTSASLAGELPPLPSRLIANGGSCYDMMYGAEPTPFMCWAAEHMAWAVSDGLGMLVEQAAESFTIWRGVRPKTEDVLDVLRRELG